jgi:hypothetical protein
MKTKNIQTTKLFFRRKVALYFYAKFHLVTKSNLNIACGREIKIENNNTFIDQATSNKNFKFNK